MRLLSCRLTVRSCSQCQNNYVDYPNCVRKHGSCSFRTHCATAAVACPVALCNSLHRQLCVPGYGTCGPCLPQHMGDASDTNTTCLGLLLCDLQFDFTVRSNVVATNSCCCLVDERTPRRPGRERRFVRCRWQLRRLPFGCVYVSRLRRLVAFV